MFDLIDRLERLGPSAAPAVLAIGAVLAAGTLAMLYPLAMVTPRPGGPATLGLIFGVLLGAGLTMVFGLVGLRLYSGPRYPSVEETFPSMGVSEFCDAITQQPRPLVSCGACRIILGAHGDSGGCPRCGSSVDWYRIENDEDAKLIISVVRS